MGHFVTAEIFQYALATDQVSEVSGFNERIESWMATWNTQKVCMLWCYGIILVTSREAVIVVIS